tara:strand:+ start:28340 stop:29362 length:1023 start_codon:yes stop_codon:yes gene_type:complete
MTFATGSAVDLEDLLSKLDTFAQTTHGGWTSIYSPNPDVTNRWFELKKGSLSFSMRYPSGIGTGDSVSVHHATGSASALTAPGAHTADSGSGYNVGTAGSSANFLSERCVSQMGNGPFPSYYFFADDTSPKDYIYCVVETVTGTFRHFGMGTLNKFGDNWVGGEFVFGHFQDQNLSAANTDPNTQTLIDGLGTTSERVRGATIRIASGLPDQSPAVWGVATQLASTSMLTDTAGNVRRTINSGYRSGLAAQTYGNAIGQGSQGYIAGYPIEVFYRNPTLARVYLLGHMDDVRAVNNRNFEPAESVVIGSETWRIFPVSLKSTASVASRSNYSGIMYRQIA